MQQEDVDRQKWATLLADLLARTATTKAELARRMGIDQRSIYRWLSQEHSVTVTNVRDAARALGVNPVHVLAQMGWISAEEAGLTGPAGELQVVHPAVQRIAEVLADPTVPAPAKEVLIRDMERGWDMWDSLTRQGRRGKNPTRMGR